MSHLSVLHWSGGKDCALALHYLQQDKLFHAGLLLTTFNAQHNRISMHGVRTAMLAEQARCLNMPLQLLQLPEQPDMPTYERLMGEAMADLKAEGYTHAVFGDIFLEDLKAYREAQLEAQGFKGHFPLWKRNTTELLKEFLDLGFKTVVVCVQGNLLPEEFAGRIIDQDFIRDLPKGVDPCGERGEFHTFAFDGPIFQRPVEFSLGEKVWKTYPEPGAARDTKGIGRQEMGFWFCDLLPKVPVPNSRPLE